MLLSTIAVAMHSQVHAHRAISRMLTVIGAVYWRSNVRMYRTTARDPQDEVRPDQPVSTERQRAPGADV